MKIIVKPMGLVVIAVLLLTLGTIAVRRHINVGDAASGAGVANAPTSAVAATQSANDSTGSGSTAGSHAAADPGMIYDDTVENGWQAPGWSWAKDVNYDFRDVKYSGTSSIRIHLKQYEGVKLHRTSPMDLDKFDRLAFEVRAGSDGVSNLVVVFGNDGKKVAEKVMELGPLPPSQWMTVTVPISGFAMPPNTPSDEIWFQSFSKPDIHFYLDDIRLVAKGQPDPTGPTVPANPL